MFGRRHRVLLSWFGFTLAVVAVAISIYRLYSTANREIAQQSASLLEKARGETLAEIQSTTDQVRQSVIKELSSFHLDGLAQMMQRWDAGDENIIGTFQWDPKLGFTADEKTKALIAKMPGLAGLWTDFRSWRSTHSGATSFPEHAVGGLRAAAYATQGNPWLPESELRYQGENLDILSHAGKPIDPWAGWAGSSADVEAPWVFWYQLGPEDAVRGCLLKTSAIVARLRSALANTQYARSAILPSGSRVGSVSVVETPGLPGYVISIEHGDLFLAKKGRTRIDAIIATTLLAILLVVGIALFVFLRKESRDAQRKTSFVAQVSHELRTPLTSIRMYADFLGQPEIAEAKRLKFASTVARETARLEALVERLLAFSALEKQKLKVSLAMVDTDALLREILEETAAKMTEAGLSPEVEITASDVKILADGSILKQAILNLIDNAAKYARNSGKLCFRIKQTNAHLFIEVSDCGPGIPRWARSRLFEPFFQANDRLTDKTPGVGLGLSLARGSLRQIGGDLFLLETPQGAAFQIKLPLKKS
jgi:signal transduction histidine kinase